MNRNNRCFHIIPALVLFFSCCERITTALRFPTYANENISIWRAARIKKIAVENYLLEEFMLRRGFSFRALQNTAAQDIE